MEWCKDSSRVVWGDLGRFSREIPVEMNNATFCSLARDAPFQRVLVRSDRIHAVFQQMPDESGH